VEEGDHRAAGRGNWGASAIAISPVNPDILYANVEAANAKGGIFRSTGQRRHLQKRMGTHNGGAMYYGDIYTRSLQRRSGLHPPTCFLQVSDDGGKTYALAGGQRFMHVDNHIIWVDPAKRGSSAGRQRRRALSFRSTAAPPGPSSRTCRSRSSTTWTWTTRAPFYNVYGGLQDNNSLGGPSRTRSEHGILNQDWFVTQGGDGFVSRVDPEDPNTVYAELQHGVIVRFDKRTGERIGIQPQEEKGGRRCAGTGTRRSSSPRIRTRASTSRRRCCSAPTIAAIRGRPSRRISRGRSIATRWR
jgi:hypothetical protein